MRKVKIIKLATIERAQDKIYPAGCTLIPLSASAPELVRFLDTASAVENRFAVVIPNEKVIPEFLFITVQRASARFFSYLSDRHKPAVQYAVEVLQSGVHRE